MKAKTAEAITFTFTRNTRFVETRGRWYCELLINGHYAYSASADTQADAKRYAIAQMTQARRAREAREAREAVAND